ncbi:MAG: TonB family protein [Bacteroidetes bacterium]|nr:TonB family protein [Bacteroidota bacterium]
MDSILLYILEANVLLVLLTILYFLIRNQLSFVQRRYALLGAPALVLMVFAFKFSSLNLQAAVYHVPVYVLDAVTVSAQTTPDTHLFYPTLMQIYWLGVGSVLLFLILRVTRILIKLRRVKAEHSQGLRIVRIENETCFSFLNYVQLNPALSASEQEVILQHEQIHFAKRHSFDILAIEIMQSFCWFNPCMILLKKELIDVHEFEVDQIMYNKHHTGYMEFLLAYSLGTNSNPDLLTNQFYAKNKLIKRLHCMKTKTKNRWAFALALPLVAGAFALISWTMDEHSPQLNAVSGTNRLIENDVEKMPEFKGGQEALINYLGTNIVYPKSAQENKVEGSVYISFVVESTGKISKCSVKRGVHTDLDNEALRVVSAMPDWIPGEKNGKPVNVEMVLPISFKL